MGTNKTLRDFGYLRTILIVTITVVGLLPLPILVPGKESRCAYVVCMMAVFWITEPIPISVTGLVPVFMFPLLNVVPAKVISKAFMNDTIMMFIGGLCMAVAIERWHIQRRIALRILLWVGTEPRWLMLGLMISTWFLSIWITNAAATAMMYPIAYAIIQQLKETRQISPEKDVIEMNANGTEVRGENTSVEIDTHTKQDENGTIQKTTDEGQLKEKTENIKNINEFDISKDPEFIRIKKALTLCIAYGATAGGVAGITGSAANLVLKGLSDELYNSRGLGAPINFATWMAYGLPLSVFLLFVCWGWLYIIFLRCRDVCSCMNKDNETRKLQAKKVRGLLEIEYKKLGSVTFGQGSVCVCFILLVIFWLTRDLGGVGGWGDLFEYNMTRDSTPAILLSFLLFVLPSKVPRVFCCRRNVYEMTEEERAEAEAPYEPLMTWKFLHEKMPWNILFLLGGGFALATACQESGLSLWIGTQLETFRGMDPWLMLFVICAICTVATEVTSNGATANLILPILANLAIGTGVNPLFYMFPATLATTFAFMLPSATPGNAIVFGYSDIKVSDMASAGLMLNILSVPLLLFATATWGNAIFHFDVVPEPFRLNSTIENVTAA
ncbi:Na(+)/citrate cotransporter-like [Haliotis asinina]|uniref:Na(+)/citrate cotransporter-like n=1 Tax=Haliotis asinina TaxID=109174 RepID=UPI0035317EC9